MSVKVTIHRDGPAGFPFAAGGLLEPSAAREPGRPVVKARNPWYEPAKRGAELVLTVALMALAAPVVAVAAALVKLTSPGPAFYAQTRVGKGGRLFPIYKIRSMVHNCEQTSGPRWSTPGDPRVTRVGRFLRRSHVDELPQLLNVLLGHMSLVGPRPERPEFLQVLQQALPGYRDRLRVRPGVTGLAQVQLPPDTDLESVRRKLAYDLCYIDRLGPWLDFRILCCTALYAAGVPYRVTRRLFLMPRADGDAEA